MFTALPATLKTGQLNLQFASIRRVYPIGHKDFFGFG
jgi:hypothetical protein